MHRRKEIKYGKLLKIPDATGKVKRRYDASPTNFCATAEIFFVQFFLFNFHARTEFESSSEPTQSKLLVLLNNLLMGVLLL
jgi:hypothetical protein